MEFSGQLPLGSVRYLTLDISGLRILAAEAEPSLPGWSLLRDIGPQGAC